MLIKVLVSNITQVITKNNIIALLVKNPCGKIVNFCKLIKAETIFWFCYFKTTVLNDTVSETIITVESLKIICNFYYLSDR